MRRGAGGRTIVLTYCAGVKFCADHRELAEPRGAGLVLGYTAFGRAAGDLDEAVRRYLVTGLTAGAVKG